MGNMIAVGDTVTIKTLDEIRRYGNYEAFGNRYIIRLNDDVLFDKEMEFFCGKNFVVKEYYNDDEFYCFNTDGWRWSIKFINLIDTRELVNAVIAVDFDNTLAYSNPETYPNIIGVNKFAIEVLKEYKNSGGKIILFTCRTNEHLQIAIDEMKKYGLIFDTINMDLPDVIDKWRHKHPHVSISPKVFCDLYIDDKAFPNNIRGIDWATLRIELLRRRKYDYKD